MLVKFLWFYFLIKYHNWFCFRSRRDRSRSPERRSERKSPERRRPDSREKRSVSKDRRSRSKSKDRLELSHSMVYFASKNELFAIDAVYLMYSIYRFLRIINCNLNLYYFVYLFRSQSRSPSPNRERLVSTTVVKNTLVSRLISMLVYFKG